MVLRDIDGKGRSKEGLVGRQRTSMETNTMPMNYVHDIVRPKQSARPICMHGSLQVFALPFYQTKKHHRRQVEAHLDRQLQW